MVLQPIIENDRFAVFDDFLAPPDAAHIWQWLQAQRYKSVHANGWDEVWRLHDGEPLGSVVVHSAPSPHTGAGAESPWGAPAHVYPTNTHIDRLIEEVSLSGKALEPLVGEQGRDWTIFTARAFIYPKETGLSWHTDHGVLSGAFSYYAHPVWNSRWGGEVLVAAIPEGASVYGSGSAFDDRSLNEVLQRIGAGQYVSPKPNRLVVIKGGTPHRINPVHPAAGAQVRCSVSGFFVRPPEDGET